MVEEINSSTQSLNILFFLKEPNFKKNQSLNFSENVFCWEEIQTY